METRRPDRIAAYVLLSILVIMVSSLAGIVFYGMFVGSGYIVRNRDGNSVPAALDLGSCEVLAMQASENPPDGIGAKFASAVHEGRIIQLANGTHVKEGDLLTYEHEHLIPWTPPSKKASGKEIRHALVCEWITPKDGPHRGRLCVRTDMVQPEYPPL